MVIAIVVVFAVVVFVARGRGGELSLERADHVPVDLGPMSATDVALLRPPTGLWGYNMQATDEAMGMIAESIRERDVRIVALEQLVTDLSRDQGETAPLGSPYPAARHRRAAQETAGSYPASGPFGPAVTAASQDPFEASVADDPVREREPFQPASYPAEPDETEATAADQPLTAPPFTAPFTAQDPAEQAPTDQVQPPSDSGRQPGTTSGSPPEQSHD